MTTNKKEKQNNEVEMREDWFASIMAVGNFISTLPEEVQIFKIEKIRVVCGTIVDPWRIIYFLPESKL